MRMSYYARHGHVVSTRIPVESRVGKKATQYAGSVSISAEAFTVLALCSLSLSL
jgi:hypothetical protein